MTGEKNRYSSVEKLWKLDDETLKTPKHDEMVLWLLNVENLKVAFPLVARFLKSGKCNGVTREIYTDGSGYSDGTRQFLKPLIKIESEKPITTSKGFIVGYFDIVVDFTSDELVFEARWANDELVEWKEFPLHIYIEVKPKIDSFGATLRQLRTYQEYEPNAVENTYLFTGDLRFKEAFQSQGIKIIDGNQRGDNGTRKLMEKTDA